MKIPGNTTGSFAPRADFLEENPKSPAFIKNNPSEDIKQAKEDIKKLGEDLKKKAADQHKHSADDINEGIFNTDRIPVVPVTKGGHGGETRKDGFTNLAFIGNDPVTEATDAPSKWLELGNGYAGTTSFCTVKQPNQYGTIISLIVNNFNVHQIFIGSDAALVFRAGNINQGWIYNWRSVFTTEGCEMTGPVTLKGIHLTPGVDYGKEFPPDAEEGRLFFVEVGVDDG